MELFCEILKYLWGEFQHFTLVLMSQIFFSEKFKPQNHRWIRVCHKSLDFTLKKLELNFSFNDLSFNQYIPHLKAKNRVLNIWKIYYFRFEISANLLLKKSQMCKICCFGIEWFVKDMFMCFEKKTVRLSTTKFSKLEQSLFIAIIHISKERSLDTYQL